ncbi:MAG: M48 family metalloprotease [Planctomycetaceae bacterium]|nr:M48 family metalloprotease [Planctomycetaceae bacterium]
MITLTCQGCGVRLKPKEGTLSKRAKCPRCGARIEATETPVALSEPTPPALPQSPSKVDPHDAKAVMRALLSGFTGTVSRRRPTWGYRITLLFTAIALCLLLLVYIALIAGAGYGVYWYAITVLPTGFHFRGRAGVFLLVAHAAVLISGVLLVFSMIAPLFTRTEDDDDGMTVSPSEAPVLHSFVAKLSEVLGAPKPVEIRLMLSPNASAGYRGGMWGLLRKQLVLTIGGPLLAGMTTQQIAGVIAHELGHFSQGGGMLLNHFVMQMARWFALAASTQQGFSNAMADSDGDDHAIVAIFRFVFWLTQLLGSLVFWGFALVGLALSMFVSRRQEFDADRYEAEIAGSSAFFGTTRRMIELALGESLIFQRGAGAILATLNEAGGVENLASEVVAAADLLAEESAPVIEAALQAPTGWLDSHPGIRDRVQAVRARPQPGLFAVKLPGYALYPRFNPN